VTFSPTKAGDFNGSISITDNAAGSPQIVRTGKQEFPRKVRPRTL
jgi:hypothetical protein